MNARVILSILAALPAAVCSVASAGGAKVEPDKENVVASRLEGAWRPHVELTKRLTGRSDPRGAEGISAGISFKSDPSVAENLPDKYVTALAERHARIYMAGKMSLEGKDLPFFLISMSGNPHVLFFLQRDGDPFGNGESFNVMLAPAKEKDNDLLFTGGDFNNEPFRAYERAR